MNIYHPDPLSDHVFESVFFLLDIFSALESGRPGFFVISFEQLAGIFDSRSSVEHEAYVLLGVQELGSEVPLVYKGGALPLDHPLDPPHPWL